LEPASLDLGEIVEFISHDPPAAARKLGREILLAAKRFLHQSRRGKLVPVLLVEFPITARSSLVCIE
jgi:plasmid stabilization system protein ParE